MALRVDRCGKVTRDSLRTGSGGLVVPALVTRTGVFVYEQTDGSSRRELRHPSEVLSPEALATLPHVAVTRDHPSEPVTAQNWARYAIGHVADGPEVAAVETEDQGPQHHVRATLVVADAAAIQDVDSGELVEISCGYYADLDPTPGTYQGQTYDGIQRNIRYNHVALGPSGWGRAGASVRLLADGGIERDPSRVENSMALVVDGKEYTEADVKALLDPKRVKEAVKQRIQIVDAARRLGLTVDEDASDMDAMIAMVSEKFPGLDLTGKSPDYVMGAYHALLAIAYSEPAAPASEPEAPIDAPEDYPEPPKGDEDMPEEEKVDEEDKPEEKKDTKRVILRPVSNLSTPKPGRLDRALDAVAKRADAWRAPLAVHK